MGAPLGSLSILTMDRMLAAVASIAGTPCGPTLRAATCVRMLAAPGSFGSLFRKSSYRAAARARSCAISALTAAL